MIGYPLPTPTPGPTSTPEAKATANAQATGTAAGQATGTQTAAQTPTATSTPAVTLTPEATAAINAATAGAAATAIGTAGAPSVTVTPSGPTATPAPTETPLPFPTYLARYRQVVATEEELIRAIAASRVLRDKLNDALGDVPPTQEQVRARHILVADETAAETVVQRLEAGEEFATLAAELSTDGGSKDKGGDLGFFPRGIMVPVFEEVAFSLEVGETSPPVNSQFGYHIIRVDERAADREVPTHQLQQIEAGAISRWLDTQMATVQIERLLDDRRTAWADRQTTG
ncbi:MAG: hypothetical protein CL878_12655 [Dehalococcoidia bacterium]|nr:hypothetical protein [Dehalococcoidia bacterium]